MGVRRNSEIREGNSFVPGTDFGYTIAGLGAGTAYSLTNTAAAVTFGTTSPSITIDKAGTYLLIANLNLLYNGATFVAVRTITTKIRRTNNTAADVITNVLSSSIITALTFTAGTPQLFAIYTTTNTNDALSLFADVNTVPSAGSLDAQAAGSNLVAIKLY